MQFQVPQFIETEDKIVGPFTLRQFFYVAGAGALCFMLFFAVATWLFVILSMFLIAAALALAFIKINGRSLPAVVLSAFRFYWNPQAYVWQPEAPQVKKEEALKSLGGGIIDKIVSGLTLKHTWQKLQTGTKEGKKKIKELSGQYEIFQRMSGDRQIARRVDYR
ncbi:MAG: PrgI family protein [Patescibacteria group bacterium]